MVSDKLETKTRMFMEHSFITEDLKDISINARCCAGSIFLQLSAFWAFSQLTILAEDKLSKEICCVLTSPKYRHTWLLPNIPTFAGTLVLLEP